MGRKASRRIDGPPSEGLARLQIDLPEGTLDSLGRGDLVIANGRATFRWTDGRPTDAAIVAAARLVHALRADPQR